MKTTPIFLTLLIWLLAHNLYAQNEIFLSEGFESGTKPLGWSEQLISNSYNWRYQDGGGAQVSTPDEKHPLNAKRGSYNALFQVEELGATSRLITPNMDLQFAKKPVLFFWTAQEAWNGNTDELKVYYRTSSSSSWVLLDTYITPTSGWDYKEIELPADAKVSTCQLAFEAKSNKGWGVCLDDINVVERGFLTEGFESGAKPLGWSEQRISGSYYWRYQNGGGAQSSTPLFKHPSAAKSGSYNALFQVEGVGQTSRLITPNMDLRHSTKPVLSFWVAQEAWDGATDELRIYYRLNSTSAWVLLDTYIAPTSGWVYKEIVLPSDAKVATFQLAFEAKSNYGWGACLDDILVDERGFVDRKVESISTFQIKEAIPSGGKGNPIAFIEIAVSGNTNDLLIQDVDLLYSGTTIDDVENLKLYYTRDSIFTPTELLAYSSTKSGNTIQLRGGQKSLLTGLNYIWICTDVVPTATHGNSIDIQIPANGLKIGTLSYPSTTQNPSGASYVEEAIVMSDFETLNGWTLTGSWQIGTQLGTGTGDPSYAYDGSKVLATNLNGNYPSNISPTAAHNATSSIANAKYYKNVNIRFKRWLNVESTDRARVWLTADGGSSWIKLMENSLDVSDRFWRNYGFDIGTEATRKSDVRVRFAIDTTDQSTEYGGWNIDNFAITGDFIAADVGVKAFVEPISKCGLTNAETVKVIVKNYGGATVSTPFNVSYSLNGGASFVNESFTSSIASEEEVEFTFTTKADFSLPGLKSLVFKTGLTNDEDLSNNTLNASFYVFPQVAFPYNTSFESSAAYWHASGHNSSWQWGVPKATLINKASVGTKAWVTNLSASYQNGELSYLESPCFDLSAAEYPVLAFDYMLQTEEGEDGFAVEYSINGGVSWNPLPQHAGYASNWYDTPNVTALGSAGWSTTTTSYVTAKNLLPADAIGVNGVKFRFVFASTAVNAYEGVAIDNIKLYELPYNTSITSLTSPTDDCEIGTTTLAFIVKNAGYRPVPSGTEIPIKVQVNSNAVVQETFTLGAELISNAETGYTTSNTFNLTNAGFHNLVIYTNFTIDDDRTNDTLKTQVEVFGMPSFGLDAVTGTTSFPLTLDAGAGFDTYSWYNLPDESTVEAATQTYQVNAEGNYRVTVTNSRGCSKSSDTEVINSDKDVRVSAINNLTDACEHPGITKPEFVITNVGDGVYDGIETIPVTIIVDGVEVYTENFTPNVGFAKDQTQTFTFQSGGMNISAAGTYNITIRTSLAKDLDKTNDATAIQISTHGMPVVELPYTEVITSRADTLTVDAGAGFATYTWEKKLIDNTWTQRGTNQTFSDFDLASAWYRVTVTDANACGSSTDEMFINAQDLGVLAIENPGSEVCFSEEGIEFAVRIQNFGQDTYIAGTPIDVTCITPKGEQTITVNLPELTAGNNTLVTFPDKVLLDEGNNFVRISTAIAGDPNPENDFIESSILVKPTPSVTINPSTVYRVFGEGVYTITPEYSADCETFLWNDGYTLSTYPINGAPAYDTYTIEATNSSMCSATASVTFITTDISVTGIKSPQSACQLTNGLGVKYTVKNSGNRVLTAGTEISSTLTLNGTPISTETYTLTQPLNVGASIDIDFVSTLDLSTLESATIQVDATMPVVPDVNADNNSFNKTVYATGNPTISLGSDREIHAFTETLSVDGTFDTYSWTLNGAGVGSESTLEASTSGTYTLTVTDFYGCTGADEVVLTFLVDDISVTSINSPTSGCQLTSAEPVQISLKNTGTWTIPSGTSIELGFSLDGVNTTESYIFESNFAPDATLLVDFTNTANLTTRKPYELSAWATLANDMLPANNTATTTVTAFNDILVEFGTDTIYTTTPVVLDKGVFYAYLWNTGATTQTITASSSGNYWLEVYNEQGCSDRDTVYVKYTIPDLEANQFITPVSGCNLSNNSTVSVRIRNTGGYEFETGSIIPITLEVNGTVVATENISLTNPLPVGDTYDYTFTATIDLSTPASYNLAATISQAIDAVATNNTITATIESGDGPSIVLGSNRSICQGETLMLDAGAAGISYLWNTGATTQTIEVSSTGTYSVEVTSADGCLSQAEVTITVNQAPEKPLGADSEHCTGVSVTLNAENSGSTYLWNTNETSQSISVTTAGEYWVEITNEHGCVTKDTINIAFTESPTIDLGGKLSLCQGNSITLNAGNEGSVFLWNTGAQTQTIEVNSGGTYSVTATNSEGCIATGTVEVEVVPAPAVNLGDDRAICQGQTVTLNPGVDNATYLWSTGAITQTIGVSAQGEYSVTVTDANGCVASDAIIITVNPRPIISLGDDIETCLGEEIILTAPDVENVVQYRWNDGTTGKILTVTQTGTYTITVTHENGCTGNDGILVTFNPLPEFDLGPETLKVNFPHTLTANIENVQYLWSTSETTQSISAPGPDEYWLTVTDSKGCEYSDTITLQLADNIGYINGIGATVNIFPNPVSDELHYTISSETPAIFSVELFSVTGQTVWREQTTLQAEVSGKINVSSLKSGLYLLKVSTAKQSVTLRVIVQ
ncbi:MAG: T9SS type A sorting domain-containing protein [Tenuifilaceae bacterium]|jgi:hypothetical protein|nr:T9SS type A sorting domain-containing protein [Tenuifilaceae bacterium]